MSKQLKRIDIVLVERGEATSREKAKSLILSGNVQVNYKRVDKPGKHVPEEAIITIQQPSASYVSRGGLKLQKAIDYFQIDLKGKTAIDVGAGTGGFTDCLIQNGAEFVYAVDVGHGQLSSKLRNDKRVAVLERTNIRHVKPQQFLRPLSFATIDVSFISLDKVLPVVANLIGWGGQILALIKPQFEVGRRYVGKGGVVKDPDMHKKVIRNVCDLATQIGLTVKGLTYSPIRGPAGNIEFFSWLEKADQTQEVGKIDLSIIDDVVRSAHQALGTARL